MRVALRLLSCGWGHRELSGCHVVTNSTLTRPPAPSLFYLFLPLPHVLSVCACRWAQRAPSTAPKASKATCCASSHHHRRWHCRRQQQPLQRQPNKTCQEANRELALLGAAEPAAAAAPWMKRWRPMQHEARPRASTACTAATAPRRRCWRRRRGWSAAAGTGGWRWWWPATSPCTHQAAPPGPQVRR